MARRDMIQLDGDKELERALRALVGKDARSAMKQGMRDAMRSIVLPAARRNAAARFGHRSSVAVVRNKKGKSISVHLKDTLKVKPVKARRGAFGYGVRTGTRQELGIPADAKGFYPIALEYGWVTARGGRHIPPRPYMRPALWDNKQRIMRAWGREVFHALRKMFGRSGYGGISTELGRKGLRPRA